MKIVADRHFNLHSSSTKGGLVHVPRRRVTVVPDDVQTDDAMFDSLVANGHIAVLKDDTPDIVFEEPEEEVEEEKEKELEEE